MKRIILLLLVISTFTSLNAQNGNFEWVRRMGGTDVDIGFSMTVDHLGNVYTTGFFGDTVDFDPGPGTTNLVSDGGKDIFVQKMDAAGNFLWVKKMGGTGYCASLSIAVDASGNVYTTGEFSGTVDFDPGPGTVNLTTAGIGTSNIFVQKMDATGNFIWAKNTGGTNGSCSYSIALDTSGNVYTTGTFRDTVDFDPGPGTANLISAGGSDIFVRKMDSAGNFIWAKRIGGTNHFLGGYSITVDASGNAYTTGFFSGTIDCDPGTGTANLSSLGGFNIFVQKMDSSGNFIWAKNMGGTSYDIAYSISVDALSNIYITGSFVGTADFDPGTGTANLTSAGDRDIFVQKMDSAGNFLWAKNMGGPSEDRGLCIEVDPSGNVYTTGFFNGTVDFNPGTGITNLTSMGGKDIFVQKMDSAGNFRWAKSMGGINNDIGQSITFDSLGYVYMTGCFKNTVDFDPGVGTAYLTSALEFDIFVIKMNKCAPNAGTDLVTACDTFTWIDGNTYTTSNNTAMHTITNVDGCDSVVTLDLIINHPNTGIDVQTACDSYTWIDGNTYSASNNTAMHTITNAGGCDSVVTLDLTINYSSTVIDTQTACDSFTWIDGNTYTTSNSTATYPVPGMNGCDSIFQLHLTINNSITSTDSITSCDAYTWIDGVTYTSNNNTSTYTLSSSNGCDSIVTLGLIIDTVDISLIVTDPCIQAHATSASFQWLDCNLGYSPIGGETQALFTANSNGHYAVEVTQNNCVDTSACVLINSVGIENLQSKGQVVIYPNPSNGSFQVDFNKELVKVEISIYNVNGDKINYENLTNTAKYNLKLNAPAGIYIMEIKTGQQKQLIRLVNL